MDKSTFKNTSAPIESIISSNSTMRTLEKVFGEEIFIEKLSQQSVVYNTSILKLNVFDQEEIIERTVLVKGRKTGRTYCVAKTLIRSRDLSDEFLEALETSKGIGEIIEDQSIETERKIITVKKVDVGNFDKLFGINDLRLAITREYTIAFSGAPVMLIYEMFNPNIEEFVV